MNKKLSAILLLLILASCQSISDFADRVDKHLPVIGERCEHWQCFTTEGKKISDANKKAEADATRTCPVKN